MASKKVRGPRTKKSASKRFTKKKSVRGRPTPKTSSRPTKKSTFRRPLKKRRRTAGPVAPTAIPADAEGPRGVRLQKFLASAGYGSRRQCEELVLTGRVKVNGKTVTELGSRVQPDSDEIVLDDVQIRQERLVYWFLNKPKGILCTNRDTHGRPTVLDLLPALTERVFPVGRLDEESTGLLLMTNDGELANRLTHPRYGVAKTYEVLVAGRVTHDVVRQLKEGIWLSDGHVRVHSVERLGLQGEATKLRIVLREGHNREIRRMFARFEHKVMRLERVAIGPIKVRKLPRGKSRRATPQEIKMLRELGTRAFERWQAEQSGEQK